MSGFSSRVHHLYATFKRKAFVVRGVAEQTNKAESGVEMKRILSAFDLFMWGVGCIIGAGVFVLTGVAARKYSGPGVIVSYGISGSAALIAALCYAEYAVELPVAGGAFNFISLTFGEFIAWVVACDLVLEYTLSAAAVAKGFTAYAAALIGLPIRYLRVEFFIFTFDIPAFLAVLLLSWLLARGSQESSRFNNIMAGINVLLIVFVLCAGLPYLNTSNFSPFMPFGLPGVFTGASIVFFSFIGFDTVACTAEEVKNPARDLPIGIVGSLLFCTVLYVMMCVTIVGMEDFRAIDLDAPFAAAFQHVGMGWATRVVAAGALSGIITSLLGSLMGQARIYVTLGRQHLLPPWIAKVDPATSTPVNATLVTSITAGLLALFFDIELLAELVSIGTLVVFFVVCSGVLFRRYYVRDVYQPVGPVLYRILAIAVCGVALSLSYNEGAHIAVPIVFLVLWAFATASFMLLPVRYVPKGFKTPLLPFLPSLGMLAALHLIGALGWPAYVRWLVWFTLGTAVYLGYSVHHSQAGVDPDNSDAPSRTESSAFIHDDTAHGETGAVDPGRIAFPHSGYVELAARSEEYERRRQALQAEINAAADLLPVDVERSDGQVAHRKH